MVISIKLHDHNLDKKSHWQVVSFPDPNNPSEDHFHFFSCGEVWGIDQG